MRRRIEMPDLEVVLELHPDISWHEHWLNAKPPIATSRHVPEWPGFEVRHRGMLIGVVARRQYDYPFCSHTFRDEQEIANRSWMLLGADLEFRRYAISKRAAVERLLAEPVVIERGAEGEDLEAISGWARTVAV